MKSFKTKIGISLTALACFLTFGCASEDYEIGIAKSKDPNVMKVAKIVEETMPDHYKTSDGKRISFSYSRGRSSGTLLYLELEISTESNRSKVCIRDYDLNNLDEQDRISYGFETTYLLSPIFEGETFEFGELSEDLQNELRKEYNLRLKEAPEKLLEARNECDRKIRERKEQEKKKFEGDVLSILK